MKWCHDFGIVEEVQTLRENAAILRYITLLILFIFLFFFLLLLPLLSLSFLMTFKTFRPVMAPGFGNK